VASCQSHSRFRAGECLYGTGYLKLYTPSAVYRCCVQICTTLPPIRPDDNGEHSVLVTATLGADAAVQHDFIHKGEHQCVCCSLIFFLDTVYAKYIHFAYCPPLSSSTLSQEERSKSTRGIWNLVSPVGTHSLYTLHLRPDCLPR
jgi:hypothetical protein